MVKDRSLVYDNLSHRSKGVSIKSTFKGDESVLNREKLSAREKMSATEIAELRAAAGIFKETTSQVMFKKYNIEMFEDEFEKPQRRDKSTGRPIE